MKTAGIPQIDSLEELARFRDEHDLTDFKDELEEVTQPVFVHSTECNHKSSYVEGKGRCTMQLDRITIDPDKMNGQPCIRGMRLTVRRVLEVLALYPDRSELQREYPELEEEDIQQALAYAAGSLDDRVVDFPYEVAA